MDEFEATPAGGQLTRRAWLAAAASATATVTLSARAATTASASPSRVRVAQGWLRGQSAGGVHRFLGIPFAQPPVGKLRWQPPRMTLAWQGTRDATQFGSCCEQAVSTLTELPIDRSRFAEEQLEQLRMRWGVISDMRASRSEDCLYLNVWTRTLDAGARQPVMVWIHGGGNLRGAGSEAAYDGAAFASKGVTLVTINYRLGAFGFLAHPNLGANFGLLDQIAALQWVQANIESLGGNPGNVTLFGESAGAADIRSLLACPQAKGLFHKVALESAGFEPPANRRNWSLERSTNATNALMQALGGGEPDDLRQVSAQRVLTESMKLAFVPPGPGEIPTPANLVWMPVPDGAVMLDEQLPAWSPDVPMLLGFNQNELRYFLRPQIRYTPELLRAMARAFCPGKADDALRLLANYGEDHHAALEALFTAAIFSEPGVQAARRFSQLGGRNYVYHFTRISPSAGLSKKLAQHTAEIRYLFGNLNDESGDAYDEVDMRLSRLMQQAWIQFAATGAPRFPDGRPWPQFTWPAPSVTTLGAEASTDSIPLNGLIGLLHSIRN